MRPIAQPKKGMRSSSFLNTKASGRGISAGRLKVSQTDWCLTSSTAASCSPVGRCSQPVTRFLMPKIQPPAQTEVASQATHRR